MSGNCLVIGDLNLDLIFTGIKGSPELGTEITAKSYSIDIGGSGGVFSTILSGLGISTYIVSKIGNDGFADFIKDKLKSFGVKIDKLVIESNRCTGITVSLSYAEDKYQFSSVKLLEEFGINDIVFKDIKNVGHVHFSSYYIMTGLHNNYLKIIKNIKSYYDNVTFSMDTNDDPKNKWGKEIYNILNNIDIFFVNKKEALMITKKSKVEDALNKLGKEVKIVIIKLGSNGYIAKDGNDIYKGESLNVNYKDSTAAGDNFDAGFIYGFINNLGVKKSLNIANICGAKSVEYIGGVGGKQKFVKVKKLIGKVI